MSAAEGEGGQVMLRGAGEVRGALSRAISFYPSRALPLCLLGHCLAKRGGGQLHWGEGEGRGLQEETLNSGTI